MSTSSTKVNVSASSTPVSSKGRSNSRQGSANSNFASFVKKVRMGKRIEKAFGRDKGQASAASQEQDDDPNKPPEEPELEPYMCTGHFQTDFNELCKRNSMEYIPNVMMRPKRPPSPTPPPAAEEKGAKGGKGGNKKGAVEAPPPEPEPEVELDENGEPAEPPPKTYTTQDKFTYFRPCIQVEMDNPDKQETVTEVYIRGWKIDEPMMTIFKQCWAKMDRLHTINLWHTGLTRETIEIMGTFLPECANLRNLVLDNNPVKEQNYHVLIKEESPVLHISLRYNQIDDTGAALLGEALGTPTQQNMKLLSLNLNGNQLTDKGAESLCKGLRMNRTLLSLSLGNNKIEDVGAKKFGEVLSTFALTHEEVVERRKLLSEKGHPDRRKSVSPPPYNRRADSRDRPGSVRSSHNLKDTKDATKGKSAKQKKEGKKEEEPKHDKHDKTKGKDKKDDKKKGASVVADSKAPKKGEKAKGKSKGPAQPEQEPSDTQEFQNPLLDQVEHMDNGVIMLNGNRTLINLNLSHNLIGEDGLKALQNAMGYQTSLAQLSGAKQSNNGLMRLCVNRNKVSKNSEVLQKLVTLMVTKDPFYKPPPGTPDTESQHA